MTVKLAINGFGRIGRNIVRCAVENIRKDIQIVAINDLASVETNAHLLKYDSIHGKFPRDICTNKSTINAGVGEMKIFACEDPRDLEWANIDIVLECTGKFTSKEKAELHLKNGAKRVLISAPATDVTKTIVFGVNHSSLDSSDRVVSNASCTTNCMAPVTKVLHENIGIKRGFMTTIHSYTADQPTLDHGHKDLYRTRAAAINMIPTSTGAAKAVGLVIPELIGKIDGVAIRVPTPNVSCIDFTFETVRPTTAEEINAAMRNASKGALKGVLATTDEKLVSMDFNHDSHSSIFATDQTKVVDDTFCRVLSWYDNEWGFSNRMLDTAKEMSKYL